MDSIKVNVIRGNPTPPNINRQTLSASLHISPNSVISGRIIKSSLDTDIIEESEIVEDRITGEIISAPMQVLEENPILAESTNYSNPRLDELNKKFFPNVGIKKGSKKFKPIPNSNVNDKSWFEKIKLTIINFLENL
jgi:hypothetical protein